MKKRKLLLLTITIAAVIIFLFINFLNISEIEQRTLPLSVIRPGPEPMPIPIQYRLWLSPLVLLFAIIPVSYYFMSKKLEKNMTAILKIISKNGVNERTVSKGGREIAEVNKNAILKLLNFNERKVLEKLIEGNGEALQSDISRAEGMNKLKAHRAMRNLELKGVVRTENHGKTKLIILSKDIKNMISK